MLYVQSIVALVLVPSIALAQSVAQRVAAVGEGRAEIRYATRAGVCGDGGDAVAMGRSLQIYPSMESYGEWSGVRCVPGPARVTLTMAGGKVTAIRTHVGGNATANARDLGVVPAREAASYLVGLAENSDRALAKEAMLAAAIADSADVTPAFLHIARDGAQPSETRRRAVMWAAQTGGSALVPQIDAIASDDVQDSRVREAALAGLAEMPDESGVAALVTHARARDDARLQKKAIFWLGQTHADRAISTLRSIVADSSLGDDVRDAAIFSVGQGDKSDNGAAFLRSQFASLGSPKLKDRVLQSVAESERSGDQRWLLGVATDTSESIRTRKQALFWAGQHGASAKAIAETASRLREPELREHIAFVLSQSDDPQAMDALLTLAQRDTSARVRKQAIFWIGQKNDPRATVFLRAMIDKP